MLCLEGQSISSFIGIPTGVGLNLKTILINEIESIWIFYKYKVLRINRKW